MKSGLSNNRWILVLALLLAPKGASSQSRLSFTLDTSTVLLRQAIWMTTTWKNNSADTLNYSCFCFEGQIKIILKDSKGTIWKYDGPLVQHETGPNEILKPGESITRIGNLLDYY